MTRRDAAILFLSGVTCGAFLGAMAESIRENADSQPHIDVILPKQINVTRI